MHDEWEERSGEVAAGAICPVAGCGAIAIAFRPTRVARSGRVESWEFTCPRCRAEFARHDHELVFQSVPRDWLLAGIRPA